MSRRIWIIAKKDKVDGSDRASASLNGCPEIVNGIPPILDGIVFENQLPLVYEEPVSPEPEPPRNLAAEIDALKTRLTALEPKEM